MAIDLGNTPEALIETNVAGVRNVVGTAVEQGLEHIVHVSSLATLFRGDGAPISEDSEPQESKHAYGHSKAMAEIYVRGLQAQGHPIKIVYPGAIIAPDDPGLTESMNAVRAFIQDFVPITSGGIQFIDARDLAVAHTRLLEAEPGPGRYLAAGTFLTWPEVANILEATTGKRPRTIPFPAPLPTSYRLVARPDAPCAPCRPPAHGGGGTRTSRDGIRFPTRRLSTRWA